MGMSIKEYFVLLSSHILDLLYFHCKQETNKTQNKSERHKTRHSLQIPCCQLNIVKINQFCVICILYLKVSFFSCYNFPIFKAASWTGVLCVSQSLQEPYHEEILLKMFKNMILFDVLPHWYNIQCQTAHYNSWSAEHFFFPDLNFWPPC